MPAQGAISCGTVKHGQLLWPLNSKMQETSSAALLLPPTHPPSAQSSEAVPTLEVHVHPATLVLAYNHH